MVKIELLEIDGINKNWDVYYLNNINGDAILFSENVEIASIGDFVELNIPSDWVAIGLIAKDNTNTRARWYSGSITNIP